MLRSLEQITKQQASKTAFSMDDLFVSDCTSRKYLEVKAVSELSLEGLPRLRSYSDFMPNERS